jgi:uncharacterized cysteine cluster protein YcgN (CxxCxxCC family)
MVQWKNRRLHHMIDVMSQDRFWERKRLLEMTEAEWESLCDGCGRCCLVKLEEEDSGEIYPTTVVCHMFDGDTCRCKDYPNRHRRVPDCLKLDATNVPQFSWLPRSCAYRRLAEGRGLAWWHPLVSGTPDTVVAAGISVKGRTQSEEGIAEDDLGDYIADWPEWK